MAISLQAKKREDLSRGVTKQIRREGDIPAVVYGKNKEPVTVSVNHLELVKTIRDEGRNAIITLDIEGNDKIDVLLHGYQTDPVKGDVIHADFFAVDLTEEMDIAVPVRLDGDAIGVRDGGVLQQPVFELQIRVKPQDIPEEIVVNVEELNIGDTISVADLAKSDKYEILDDPETAVATVTAPQEEAEPAEDGDVNVEPELVGAKDDEETE